MVREGGERGERECIYSDGARDRKQIPGQESIIHLPPGFPSLGGCYRENREEVLACLLFTNKSYFKELALKLDSWRLFIRLSHMSA